MADLTGTATFHFNRKSPLPLPYDPDIATHAYSVYIARIKGRQYAIRAVPTAIDRALRHRAKREAKSLNAVAVEALARGLKLEAKPAEYIDLDALIGSWEEDPAFDHAVADFERVDAEAWR